MQYDFSNSIPDQDDHQPYLLHPPLGKSDHLAVKCSYHCTVNYAAKEIEWIQIGMVSPLIVSSN